jgi:branched-chain amino acid aminotransferase
MTVFWMDGALVAEQGARISLLDHGLLYGDGVFEGIRCLEGRVLDLELHLERFEHSARALYLPFVGRARCTEAVLGAFAALGADNAYARLVLTRGVGALGIDVSSCDEPRLFCIAGQITLYNAKPDGLSLATVSLRRPDADVLDPKVKSLNYLNNVLAKMEAKRQGADEALVLNRHGVVAEASAANVFALLDGMLCTPPTSDGALGGITRRRVLGFARELGLSPTERTLTRYDLLASQGVFLTGTGAGVVDVGSLDRITLRRATALVAKLQQMTLQYALQRGTPVKSP